MTDMAEITAAASDLLEMMEEALHVHVYGDDDPIPANCQYVAAIERLRAALGMAPADIPTIPVWAYSATFCNADGDRDSYSTEVTGGTVLDALTEGRQQLAFKHRGITKVDAAVSLIAGEA